MLSVKKAKNLFGLFSTDLYFLQYVKVEREWFCSPWGNSSKFWMLILQFAIYSWYFFMAGHSVFALIEN